jgi:hypothetical protein
MLDRVRGSPRLDLDTLTEAAISSKGGGETTCREMLLTRTRCFITRASRQSLLTTPAPWHVVTPFPELAKLPKMG